MTYTDNDFIKKSKMFSIYIFYYGNANVLDLIYIKTS